MNLTVASVHPHELPPESILSEAWSGEPFLPESLWYAANAKFVINPLGHNGLNLRDPDTGRDTGVAVGGRTKGLQWTLPGTCCGKNPSTGTQKYRKTSDMRYMVSIEGRLYSVADIVWLLVTGHLPILTVDHKSGNALDNSPPNLRLLTHRQNRSAANENKVSSRPQSKYTGVRWTHTGNWACAIKINSISIHLGTFEDEHDAHLVYQGALPLVGQGIEAVREYARDSRAARKKRKPKRAKKVRAVSVAIGHNGGPSLNEASF